MTQLTEADYAIDMEALLRGIGIEPGTVAANTAQVQFLDGKAVLTYTAMRAIPPRLLGAAMLHSAPVVYPEDGEQEPTPPTPIKKATAKRTTKKATTPRAKK